MDAELQAYNARWRAVAEIERQELQTASMELRWRQLNAVVGIAIGLDIFQPDQDEIEVHKRWAKLKEEATSQHPTISSRF